MYMNPGYGTLTLSMKDNNVHLKFGEFDTPLIQYHYDSFLFKWEFYNFYFILTFDSGFSDNIEGSKIKFEEKVPPIYFKRLKNREKQ